MSKYVITTYNNMVGLWYNGRCKVFCAQKKNNLTSINESYCPISENSNTNFKKDRSTYHEGIWCKIKYYKYLCLKTCLRMYNMACICISCILFAKISQVYVL